LKCGYGEEWKRLAGLKKLIMSKRRQANTELYLAKETSVDWLCFKIRWTFA